MESSDIVRSSVEWFDCPLGFVACRHRIWYKVEFVGICFLLLYLPLEIIKLFLCEDCCLALETQVAWLKILYIMEVVLFIYFGLKIFFFSER